MIVDSPNDRLFSQQQFIDDEQEFIVKQPSLMTTAIQSTEKIGQWLITLRWPAVVGLALAFHLLYISLKLIIGDFDISRFITAGDLFTNFQQLSQPIHVLANSPGYDGQFYYRLALDPFTSQVIDYGIRLDNPSFRMQRIGYPLLVWLLTCNGTTAVPWIMVLVNLAAIGLIAFFGSKIVTRFQQPPIWALSLALYPGLVISLSRNLTECLALALALAAINSAQLRQHFLANLLGVLAVLCRETTLFILLGFGIPSYSYRWKNNWLWYLLPPIIFLGWQITLHQWWGQSPHSGGLQDIGIPFVGYFQLLWNILHQENLFNANPFIDGFMRFYTSIAALGVGLTLLVTLPRLRQAPTTLTIPWIAYATLIVCLSNVIWLTPGEFLRGFSETYTLSMLILLSTASLNAGKGLAVIWALILIPTALVFLH